MVISSTQTVTEATGVSGGIEGGKLDSNIHAPDQKRASEETEKPEREAKEDTEWSAVLHFLYMSNKKTEKCLLDLAGDCKLRAVQGISLGWKSYGEH